MKWAVKGTVKKVTENAVIILLLPNLGYILVSVRLFLKKLLLQLGHIKLIKSAQKYVFIFVFQMNAFLLNCIFINESWKTAQLY